jgi:hypothetical protein
MYKKVKPLIKGDKKNKEREVSMKNKNLVLAFLIINGYMQDES